MAINWSWFICWLIGLTVPGKSFLPKIDLIAPVPLHPLRLWRRRYNQSGLLAQALGRKRQINTALDLLRQIRYRQSQFGLSRKARIRNVAGSMTVTEKWRNQLRGRHILVIDDVMTTGATLRQCGKVLLRHGAGAVYAITLARVLREWIPWQKNQEFSGLE